MWKKVLISIILIILFMFITIILSFLPTVIIGMLETCSGCVPIETLLKKQIILSISYGICDLISILITIHFVGKKHKSGNKLLFYGTIFGLIYINCVRLLNNISELSSQRIYIILIVIIMIIINTYILTKITNIKKTSRN